MLLDTDLIETIKEAKAYAEMKREAEKLLRPLVDQLKARMKAAGLTEITLPDGTKVKLSTSNRTNADRKLAEALLDPDTFTKIFKINPVDQLKIT